MTMALVPTNVPPEKWTMEETSMFLDSLVTYPALWDFESEEYKNRSLKEESMNSLVVELQRMNFSKEVSAEVLKKKIKNIRDTYTAELRKVQRSKKTGTSKTAVYQPPLPWYDQADAFLRSSCITRMPSSNLEVSHLEINTNMEEEDADDPEPNNMDSTPYHIGRSTHNRAPHSKNLRSDEILKGAISKLEKISSGKSDEFDGFGKTVAAQLRRLPEDSAWEAQDKITRLLREAIKGTRANSAQSLRQTGGTPAIGSNSQGSDVGTTVESSDTQNVRHTSDSNDLVDLQSLNNDDILDFEADNQFRASMEMDFEVPIPPESPLVVNEAEFCMSDDHCYSKRGETLENEQIESLSNDVSPTTVAPLLSIENLMSISSSPSTSIRPSQLKKNRLDLTKIKGPIAGFIPPKIIRVRSKEEVERSLSKANPNCKSQKVVKNVKNPKDSSAISQLFAKTPSFANVLCRKNSGPVIPPRNQVPAGTLPQNCQFKL